ncbi:TauD/TfdA family dioxygenase [Alphaproteobacteria bacterium]|nr:TauD/TfdA family dioxygenase [Alphaproteobacteria bacterium]MDC6458496.1 TauD/TfdA family dioxygenase [Alphaproteobacteria bacterium]
MAVPNMIDSPAAWHGRDMANDPAAWIYSLTPADIEELEAAARSFKDSGLPLGLISRALFPLPEFGDFLRQLQTDLRKGKGFKLVRGLPVSRYNAEVYATIFCGIGSHLGSARSQNAAGHLLGHVRDIGADVNNPNTRIYQTTARQSFHTDSCDVVGLLCLKEAKEGGDSMLASSVTAYNEIAKRRPDLVPALFEPVATDRRGEVPDGQSPFFMIPVFTWHEGYLTCLYQRNYINSAQRFDQAPKLTPQQKQALDLLDEIVNDPLVHLKMRLRPGDMQFVYNHSLLHDRTGFVDWPEPEERRHLLRLWLALPDDRPLPPSFKQRYGKITIGDRGGVVTSETVLHAPIDA